MTPEQLYAEAAELRAAADLHRKRSPRYADYLERRADWCEYLARQQELLEQRERVRRDQ